MDETTDDTMTTTQERDARVAADLADRRSEIKVLVEQLAGGKVTSATCELMWAIDAMVHRAQMESYARASDHILEALRVADERDRG